MIKKMNSGSWLGVLLLVAGLLLAVKVLAQTATNTGTTDSPQTTCTTGGGKWCFNSDQASGWCSYSSSPCPAYDSASCSAQSGEWCAYTGGSGGWCATGGASCPINDEATCVSKGRPWCKNSSGSGSTVSTYGGWCGEVGYKCPAYDEPSCIAQGSEWCVSSYGGSGWCSTMPGSCPINDKATCATKGRTWCVDSSAYSASGGWCATIGSACPSTTSNTSSSTYTPVPSTYTWPSTESDCTKYKGVWCPSSYTSAYSVSAGACYMAGQTCPSATPSGKMSCWDGSYVETWSNCPITPTTKSDCETKGYKWCDSSGSSYTTYNYSSGWCTGKYYNCPTYPPAGKMTCPDGTTFASSLTDCPTVVTAPTTKICWDNTIVNVAAECPIKYTYCPDGTSKVPEGTACPVKTEEPATTCLDKGGKWCLNEKSGSAGYCVFQGDCNPTIKPAEFAPDQKQIKLIEAKKKEYLRTLDTLEKTIKRFNDQESLAKIATLREKLSTLQADENTLDALEAIKDDILALRDVKNDLLENQGEIDVSERDKAMQTRALKQLKQAMAQFNRQLGRIQTKANRLEKQGFAIPDSLRELINQGREFASKIQSTKDYEVARDMAESLAALSEDLNLWMPKLEQLVRINQFSKLIQSEINKREAEYKRTQALVKRLKADMEDYMNEIRAMLDSAKDAHSRLRTREWAEEDPLDFVQEEIIDKLESADDAMANIRALANLKATVNKIKAQISKYDARIARLAKQKKDVAELKELAGQLKEVYDELKALAGTKLLELDLANMMEKLSLAENLTEQIDDLLKIGAPSALEKALKGNLKIEKIDTPVIEREVIRAHRVAIFFRRAPHQMAEYFSSAKEAAVNTINRWRNRLAID